MITILALAALLSLAGSEWGVAGSEQYIQFREGRVSGHSGCNRFTGGFVQEGEALKLGPLASTKMACAPERMAQELAWFQMLDKVRVARTSDPDSVLKREDLPTPDWPANSVR